MSLGDAGWWQPAPEESPGVIQQQELEAQTQVTLQAVCVTRAEERGLMRNKRDAPGSSGKGKGQRGAGGTTWGCWRCHWPSATHPQPRRGGGQGQRGAGPPPARYCSWMDGGPWSSQVAAFNEHQGNGAPCCLRPSLFGSVNPEQMRASCAAHKDFDLPRIFPSRGAAFIPLGNAKLLDLLLTGNVHCACPSFPSP